MPFTPGSAGGVVTYPHHIHTGQVHRDHRRLYITGWLDCLLVSNAVLLLVLLAIRLW